MAKIVCSFNNALDDIEVQADLAMKESITRMCISSFNGLPLEEINPKDLVAFQKKNTELVCFNSQIGYTELNDDFTMATKIFETAKETKVKLVSCYSFFKVEEEREEELIKVFKALADLAKKYGIILCIRNDVKTNTCKADELLDFITKTDKSNVKVAFDTAQFIMNDEILLPAYRHVKKELAFIYIDDTYMNKSVLVGCGNGKITDFLAVLEKDEYDGYYVINLEFNDYLERDIIYKKAKLNLFLRFTDKYKFVKYFDEKIGKNNKEEVNARYLASLQLRFLKKLIK